MMPCKKVFIFLTVLAVLLSSTTGNAQHSENPSEIFNSEGFWKAFSFNDKTEDAWEKGVKWERTPSAYAVYNSGKIYGFSARKIPFDKEIQLKLNITYAERAEIQAINTVGIFSFNDLSCPALSEYETLQEDINLCSNLKLESKLSSSWNNIAFSIIQISASEICSCRKAMDKGLGDNNSNTFYGAIARNEISLLYSKKFYKQLLDFFNKNYSRKIFEVPELTMVADSFAKNEQPDNAKIILDAILSRYADTMNSDQLEQCGDIYYAIGESEIALSVYERASQAFGNSLNK
jgi:hypothetical protein